MDRIPTGGTSRLPEHQLAGLLLSGLGGNEADYARFLGELAMMLRGFFRKRLYRLQEETEDLVQETLLAVHNQKATYDASLPVSSWVYAIARYKLVDLLRRRAAKDLLTDTWDESNEILSTADTDAAEARRDLFQLLEALPDHQRLPIMHTKIDGLSVAEASRRTGMSESAVKVGVHRGLKALAARIKGATSRPTT
ncbi:MAG: sigma-70 family RNA polymerase sigma factor [Steroidobacterales bacterium]